MTGETVEPPPDEAVERSFEVLAKRGQAWIVRDDLREWSERLDLTLIWEETVGEGRRRCFRVAAEGPADTIEALLDELRDWVRDNPELWPPPEPIQLDDESAPDRFEEEEEEEEEAPDLFEKAEEEDFEFLSGLFGWKYFMGEILWFAEQSGLEVEWRRRRRWIFVQLNVTVRGRRSQIGQFASYARERARKSRPSIGGNNNP